jgi:hypothetical protein
MANSLQNPIQALGLLIDNSINMGSNIININVYIKNLSK